MNQFKIDEAVAYNSHWLPNRNFSTSLHKNECLLNFLLNTKRNLTNLIKLRETDAYRVVCTIKITCKK